MPHAQCTSDNRTQPLLRARLLRNARKGVLLCLWLLPLVTQARLGENVADTVKRYGPTFMEVKDDDLSYQTYQFKGCEIDVFFLDGQSVAEYVNFKPQDAYGQDAVQKALQEVMTLAKGILSGAYGFSGEDVDAMWTSLELSGRTKSPTAEVLKYQVSRKFGEIHVTVVLVESRMEDFAKTIRLQGYLSLRAPQSGSDAIAKRMQALMNTAAQQQQAQTQNTAADGF